MCRCDARDRCASKARMIAAKMRLVHDPSVGVSDLMIPIKNMIGSKDDRNIYKLVMPPPGVTWKSAAPVSWMANLSTLFKDYVTIASNSVVSSKKHKQALVRLDDTEKINFTRKVQADFVDAVDDAIRCGLAHFRTLKQMDDAKICAFRKADEDQQKAIQEVLDLIQIEKGQELEVPVSHVHNQQVVPATPAKTPSPSPANQPSSSTGFDAVRGIHVMDYESVFDAVVTGTRRSLEEDFEETEVGPNNCTITYFGKKDVHKQNEESPPVKKKQKENNKQEDATPSPQKAGPFQLALTDADRKILEKAQDASPIAKDGKTQQQRLNAQKPPKKGKGKGQGKAQEKQQKEKRQSSVLKKRPSTAMSVEPKGGDKVPAKPLPRKPSSEHITADPNSFELVLPEHLPDPAASIPRGKARNAYVSWAYHHSITAAKRTGCNDKETLAKVGRRAHAEAGKIFDQAWPKEGDTTQEMNQDQIKKKAKTGKTNESNKDEKETQKEEEKTEKDATPRLRRRTKTNEASAKAAARDVD